jgi:hypothetical protein
MKYLIGSYEFENATVAVQRTPVRVAGSLLRLNILTHNITGRLRADTTSALDAMLNNFEGVFNANGVSQVGLFFDDGSPTQHVIQNAATADGIKLIAGPNYPEGRGAEYALYRTVQFTLQAEVRNLSVDLVTFQETISISGGTRPSTWLLPADGNPPIRQRLVRVPYVVTQQGNAETYSPVFAWPNPLGEEPDEIQQTNVGPQFSEGGLAVNRWQWSYRWTTLQSGGGALRPTDRRFG